MVKILQLLEEWGTSLSTKKIKTKGIAFKTLCNFLLIISIIIFLIWLLEISLFEPIYRSIQTENVEDINEDIVSNYEVYELDNYLRLSVENNCNIIIFKVEDKKAEILYNTSRTNNPIELNITINQFLNNLGNQSNVSYINSSKDSDVINVGEVRSFDSVNIYFYVSANVTPVSSAIEVSTMLLLIISIVSLITTFIVSLILSRKLSAPLQKLSEEAKELSNGNLDMKFTAIGYDEVETLSSTLNYSIEEIKKSDKLQKEVIQNVSHELRTPLTLIQSYAELIGDYSGNNPEKRKKHTKIIIEESKKLENLINDMLDLSKMQSKTIKYDFIQFNLSEVLEKLEDFYKTKYIEYEFVFKYPKKCIIKADKLRIEQVFINLINNAINYSQNENRKVIIELKKKKNEKVYTFSVKDFGIGIAEEDIGSIFTRHFRAFSAKRSVAGSGVGLSIVKEILDAHQLDIRVESKLNVGSSFYIDFFTVE